MAYFPTGAQARERAQNNNTLAQQISIMEISVLNSIASSTFTATISDTNAALSVFKAFNNGSDDSDVEIGKFGGRVSAPPTNAQTLSSSSSSTSSTSPSELKVAPLNYDNAILVIKFDDS